MVVKRGVSRDGHYRVLITQKGFEFSWIILEMMKSIQISNSGVYFCLFDLIFALEKYVNHYFRFRRVRSLIIWSCQISSLLDIFIT